MGPKIAGVVLGLTLASCAGQGGDEPTGSTGEISVTAYGGPAVDTAFDDSTPPDQVTSETSSGSAASSGSTGADGSSTAATGMTGSTGVTTDGSGSSSGGSTTAPGEGSSTSGR